MRILARSRLIRNALRTVRARIPARDWQMISSFLSRIKADVSWETLGLSDEVSRGSAELMPLFPLKGNILSIHPIPSPQGQIRFALPVCRLFSKKAMTGLVAHELAHALRAAKIGEEWPEKMGAVGGNPGANRRYRLEERRADKIASGWGFGAHIRAMREERLSILEPHIESREERILHRIERRDRIAEEKARLQFLGGSR